MFTKKSLLTILGLISTAISIGSFIAGLLGDKTAFGIGVLIFAFAILSLYMSLRPTTDGRIDSQQAASMLKDLIGISRAEAIGKLYPNLSSNPSGYDVSLILDSLMGSSRVDAIAVLASKIRKSPSPEEIELVLGNLIGSLRVEAVEILASSDQDFA